MTAAKLASFTLVAIAAMTFRKTGGRGTVKRFKRSFEGFESGDPAPFWSRIRKPDVPAPQQAGRDNPSLRALRIDVEDRLWPPPRRKLFSREPIVIAEQFERGFGCPSSLSPDHPRCVI